MNAPCNCNINNLLFVTKVLCSNGARTRIRYKILDLWVSVGEMNANTNKVSSYNLCGSTETATQTKSSGNTGVFAVSD
jgi:hypothetical protein